MKICNKCKDEKELCEFNKDKTKKDGYMNFCKKCRSVKHILNKDDNNERCRIYYFNNKDILYEKHKIIVENNRERYAEYYRKKNEKYKDKYRKSKLERNTARRKVDPLFKLTGNIRTLISKTIREFGVSKKSKSYIILGCSFEEFKIYLEKQFINGMTWDNYGEWHLDHKKPISLAKTEEEIYEFNHYSNFQPLWQFDNLSKGNKYKIES